MFHLYHRLLFTGNFLKTGYVPIPHNTVALYRNSYFSPHILILRIEYFYWKVPTMTI